jgi:hypothetical protein
VLAADQIQYPEMDNLGELLSKILLSPELTPHRSESSSEPSEQPTKERQMQRIITHFLGNISFETSNLQEIADSLDPHHDQDQSDTDSILSHHATPANDYSIDPLSTSTMRKFCVSSLSYVQLT